MGYLVHILEPNFIRDMIPVILVYELAMIITKPMSAWIVNKLLK